MEYIELIGYKNEARVAAKIESIEYYPFHLHKNDIEIICVLNGIVKISDSAATYNLSYGDVYIFNANDPHKITSDDPDSILLTVHIDRNHYVQYFSDLPDSYFICDTYADRDRYSMDIKHLRFKLAKLYRSYTENSSPMKTEECARELIELLMLQFRQYTYQHEDGHPAAIVRLQNPEHLYKNYTRMYRIVDYVMEHFREKLTLQQMAEMEYLSTAHLSRYIKETLGLTFSQLVSLTRCEEASRLLSATNKTVDLIAEEAGFANRKHLASQFRRWYQQTPTQYRNAILKDLRSSAKVSLRPFDYNFSQTLIEMYLDEY